MGGITETIIIGAAIGAGVGAATAIVTGGNPLKGALFGAIGGAVTAGVGSALGGAADAAITAPEDAITNSADGIVYDGATDSAPFVDAPAATDELSTTGGEAANLTTNAAENPGAVNELGQPVVPGTGVPAGPGPGGASGGAQLAEATPTAGPTPAVGGPTAPTAGGTAATGAPDSIIATNAPETPGFSPSNLGAPADTTLSPLSPNTPATSNPSWLQTATDAVNKNPGVASVGGGLINGLGTGIAGMAQASATKNAAAVQAQNATNLAQEGQSYVAGNYANPGGLLNPTAPVSGLPTPQQRFDPRTAGGQYQFNPQTGTIDFVKNSGPQPIGAPTQASAPTPTAVAIGAGGQAGVSGAGA